MWYGGCSYDNSIHGFKWVALMETPAMRWWPLFLTCYQSPIGHRVGIRPCHYRWYGRRSGNYRYQHLPSTSTFAIVGGAMGFFSKTCPCRPDQCQRGIVSKVLAKSQVACEYNVTVDNRVRNVWLTVIIMILKNGLFSRELKHRYWSQN